MQILISYLEKGLRQCPGFLLELVLTARVSIIPMFDLLLLMLQYLHLPLKMREQAGKESSCAVCGSHSDSASKSPLLKAAGESPYSSLLPGWPEF